MDQERFDAVVRSFETATDRHSNPLGMHYLLVKQGGTVFLHRFGDRRAPSDVRSISKTVMALLAGLVIAERGDIDEDTPVWPVLQRVAKLENRANAGHLERVKLKHLLNHTIGFDDVLLMRGDIAGIDPTTFVDHIVNSPIVHEPGEHYLYSNAGYYLLSVFLQEHLEQDLLAYADRVLFSRLGIVDYRWERYGSYLAGATRLWLHPHDLLKIGELLLYGGRGLVAQEWVEHLKQETVPTPQVDTPSNPYFRRRAYANGLWLGGRGVFFGHGTDGQTLAVVPDVDAVVLTTAHQRDVTRLEELVDETIAALH